MKKLIALPLLFIIAISACANDFPDISVKELQKALEKGNVAVIDVNGARTFDKGHIPTAIHYSSSKDKLSSLLPKDKNTLVVSYCGGPGCYRRPCCLENCEALSRRFAKPCIRCIARS